MFKVLKNLMVGLGGLLGLLVGIIVLIVVFGAVGLLFGALGIIGYGAIRIAGEFLCLVAALVLVTYVLGELLAGSKENR